MINLSIKTNEELATLAAEYMAEIVAQIENAQQLTKADRLNMDILERNIYKYLQAEKFIYENDIVLFNSASTAYENPANHISAVCLAKIMEIATQYGITALSRKKLAIEQVENSPIGDLLIAAARIKNAPPVQQSKKSKTKKARK